MWVDSNDLRRWCALTATSGPFIYFSSVNHVLWFSGSRLLRVLSSSLTWQSTSLNTPSEVGSHDHPQNTFSSCLVGDIAASSVLLAAYGSVVSLQI